MDSLSSWLSLRGAMEPGDAVGWVIRMARALETLHLQGKVHGAVSAEALRIADASPSSNGALTRPDPREEYLSPERLKTGRPSAADDAWALALVLFTALTSYHPFEGDDEEDTHEKIRQGPVPPLVAFGIVDEQLQQILGRMLERDLLNRVVAVEPFRRALEGWAQGPEYAPLDGLDDLLLSAAALPGHNPLSLSMPPMPLPSLAPGRPSSLIPAARPSVAPIPPPSTRIPSEPPVEKVARKEEPPQDGLTPTAPLPPARSAPPAAPPQPATTSPAAQPTSSGGKWGAILVSGALLAGGGVWWSQRSPAASPVGVPLGTAGTTATAVRLPEPSTQASAAASTPPAPLPSVAPSASAAPSASVASSASAAPSIASAPVALPASALPLASAAPSASSGAAPAESEQCMRALFPADAFSTLPSSFASLCKEGDPRKGAALIRDEVIRASSTKRSSQVMTEWAVLSWYELAVFAAL